MRSIVIFSCFFVTIINSAPSWLDSLIGYQDPYSNPSNDYNGYEQAPYTIIQQYQVGFNVGYGLSRNEGMKIQYFFILGI